jgi:small subunit ribosomal protein S18
VQDNENKERIDIDEYENEEYSPVMADESSEEEDYDDEVKDKDSDEDDDNEEKKGYRDRKSRYKSNRIRNVDYDNDDDDNNKDEEEDDRRGRGYKGKGRKGTGGRRGRTTRKQSYSRKKVSRLYKILGADKKVWDEKIDYKNVDLLSNFITEAGKIAPRRATGVSPLYHRKIVREIKKARMIALLPFRVKD